MNLRNKIKTGIATLLVGSALAIGGCEKECKQTECDETKEVSRIIEGQVVQEFSGSKGLVRSKIHAYLVKDKNNKYHIGVFNSEYIDPFNEGDCVRLKLGEVTLREAAQYVNRKLVTKTGCEILEYEKVACPKK